MEDGQTSLLVKLLACAMSSIDIGETRPPGESAAYLSETNGHAESQLATGYMLNLER